MLFLDTDFLKFQHSKHENEIRLHDIQPVIVSYAANE